jgi:ribose 5-phosphate isomerase B
MRVHIGGDHAAFDLKNDLVVFLEERGYDVIDHGPDYYDAEDDYPVAVLRAAEAVSGDLGAMGIVLGGSGNGEQIAANKVRGIRAALAYRPELAQLARAHNNAQVVSIGARMNTVEEARAICEVFLTTPFSGEERHARRLAMVERYEQDGELPPIPAGEG